MGDTKHALRKVNNTEIRPGMVIVTEGGHNFTGRFLKWAQNSRFTHVILVTGENEFIEADASRRVGTGVLTERLFELFKDLRAFVILDMPDLTDEQREAIVAEAKKYNGRRYDYLKAIQWFVTRRFFSDGPLRLICSRLITAAFWLGAKVRVFKHRNIRYLSGGHQQDLGQGFCIPVELLLYGDFIVCDEVWPVEGATLNFHFSGTLK